MHHRGAQEVISARGHQTLQPLPRVSDTLCQQTGAWIASPLAARIKHSIFRIYLQP